MGRGFGTSFRESFLCNRRLIDRSDLAPYGQAGIGRHGPAQRGVWRQNAVITMAMLARRWYQNSQLSHVALPWPGRQL